MHGLIEGFSLIDDHCCTEKFTMVIEEVMIWCDVRQI